MSALERAAVVYASLGWQIHPCRPREKLPILKDWPAMASSDRELIGRWWGRTPDANVAVATGPKSGIFVLDIDGQEGERALVYLERRFGEMPEIYPMQWTGSGRGSQAFFAWPEGRKIRNSAGRLGPKLDIRGDGGYVLLPPSIHPSGRTYTWAADRNPFLLPPCAAPAWLIELLDPPPPLEQDARPAPATCAAQVSRYIEKALATELKLTARAPRGERNSQLFESASSLLRFVQDGRLSKAAITVDLRDAAAAAGLSRVEIERTLKSAAMRRRVTL